MSEESSAELRHAPKAHLLTTQKKMICSRLGGKHSAFQFFFLLFSYPHPPHHDAGEALSARSTSTNDCGASTVLSRQGSLVCRQGAHWTGWQARDLERGHLRPRQRTQVSGHRRFSTAATCALRRVAESMRTPKGFLPGQKGGSTPH